MNPITPEANLEARAELFKALGHPARLLMLNLIRVRPRHGEELAAILNLNPATISHHLGRLAAAGLLSQRRDQYYTVYTLVDDLLSVPLGEMIALPQQGVQAGAEVDAYRQKVLKTFFRHGRLVQIPAQLKKQQVILERLRDEFEPGRRYSEQEVNRILLEFHEDVAWLRRALVDHRLMQRERGIYWRADDAG